jgi:hypothetical protein
LEDEGRNCRIAQTEALRFIFLLSVIFTGFPLTRQLTKIKFDNSGTNGAFFLVRAWGEEQRGIGAVCKQKKSEIWMSLVGLGEMTMGNGVSGE